MDYQVWTKEEYGDNYTKVDCGDLAAAEREIDAAVRRGEEPILTVEVPYELSIKVSEVGEEVPKTKVYQRKGTITVEEGAESEADKGEAGPGEDTGAESTS